MATVPRATGFDVNVRPVSDTKQSSIASPALFGAAGQDQAMLGAGIANAGGAVVNIVNHMQDQENTDMLFRAETSLKNDYSAYETKARERKGAEAKGLTEDTKTWWDTAAKTHADNLGNDAVRRLFLQRSEQLRTQSLDSFGKYESGQRQASLDASTTANIVGTTNLAAAMVSEAPRGEMTEGGYKQPFDLTPYKGDIIKQAAVQSKLKGDSPEVAAARQADYLTNFHKQIIQNRLDIDPSGAKHYFEANKGEINGSEYDSIQKSLKISGIKGQAQEWVDRIDMTHPAFSEAAALEGTRQEFKDQPEARDAAITELKTRLIERTQVRERAQKTAGDEAWKIYSQTNNVLAIPTATLAAMDGKDVENLRAHARTVSEGKATRTDFSAWVDARDAIVSGKEVNLRDYVNTISTADLKGLSELQTNPEKKLDAASLTAQLSNTHDQLGWGSGDKQKKGLFDKAVSEAVNVQQKLTGKTMNQEERQKVIDKMIMDGEVDGSGWFSDKKKFFEVSGTDDAKKFEPKITKADRKTIVDWYDTRFGRAPTEEEINDRFKKWKGF